MVLFGRTLRRAGLGVTPPQISEWVRATRWSGFEYHDFRNGARALLVSHQRQLPTFERLFDHFWLSLPGSERPREWGRMLERSSSVQETLALPQAHQEGAEFPPEAREEGQPVRTWSAREVLRQKDFADLDEEERRILGRMMRELRWNPGQRRSRRRQPARRGRLPDWRRSLRRSLSHDSELLLPAWQTSKTRPLSLVVLCDVSGSMEPYSRILLQFLVLLDRGVGRVESFAFGTRLTRLTLHLGRGDVDSALRKAARLVLDWGGGTRTGAALKTFNYRWARRVLARPAVVMIISDGWDRGDIDLLSREMERLSRSARRLIWLNPLLGSPRYRPLTRGMQAALPHLDDFLPVHNLASLEQLARHLARLE